MAADRLVTSWSGTHENVTNLIGISSHVVPEMLVFEATGELNLQEYLRNRNHHLDDDDVSKLRLCLQICSALSFLHRGGYVHRDVAAKNVLVGGDRKFKLSLFGTGPSFYPQDYDSVSGQSFPIPVRWTSPEVLDRWLWSHKSDIWSFGCLVWEVFTSCRRPLAQYSDTDILERVKERSPLKLSLSGGCVAAPIVAQCLTFDPEKRPTALEVKARLGQLLAGRAGSSGSDRSVKNTDVSYNFKNSSSDAMHVTV